MSSPRLALYAPQMGDDAVFGPDGPLEAFAYRALRDELRARGGACHTLDVFEARGESPDVVLFLEVPVEPVPALLRRHPQAEAWVVLLESEAVHPPNWDPVRHREFTHLFTWNDELVDDVRYHKGNFAQPLVPRDGPPPGQRPKFATLIAGHKLSRHPCELYSQRIATIRWYERHHPELFDLYGRGWGDLVQYVGAPAGRMGHLMALVRPPRHRSYPSWRGTLDDKLGTLADYRFSICYENAVFPGYITEKLFDCMLAGTVPVYWGAPNITKHVPAECFIDRRRFANHEHLHEHLVSLSDQELDEMSAAGRTFVAGESVRPFGGAFFVDSCLNLLGLELVPG